MIQPCQCNVESTRDTRVFNKLLPTGMLGNNWEREPGELEERVLDVSLDSYIVLLTRSCYVLQITYIWNVNLREMRVQLNRQFWRRHSMILSSNSKSFVMEGFPSFFFHIYSTYLDEWKGVGRIFDCVFVIVCWKKLDEERIDVRRRREKSLCPERAKRVIVRNC